MVIEVDHDSWTVKGWTWRPVIDWGWVSLVLSTHTLYLNWMTCVYHTYGVICTIPYLHTLKHHNPYHLQSPALCRLQHRSSWLAAHSISFLIHVWWDCPSDSTFERGVERKGSQVQDAVLFSFVDELMSYSPGNTRYWAIQPHGASSRKSNACRLKHLA